MKVYFVFAGHHYYPSGGMDDFKGSFETYEAALAFVTERQASVEDWRKWEWHNIVNISNRLNDTVETYNCGEDE